METSAYLHCLPEICTDASRDYSKFYSEYRSCNDFNKNCELKRTKRSPTTKFSLLNVLSVSESQIRQKNINCSVKYTIGPLRVKMHNTNLIEPLIKDIKNDYSQNKGLECKFYNKFLILYIYLIFKFLT